MPRTGHLDELLEPESSKVTQIAWPVTHFVLHGNKELMTSRSLALISLQPIILTLRGQLEESGILVGVKAFFKKVTIP